MRTLIGDMHTHTLVSGHAYGTIREMAQAAAEQQQIQPVGSISAVHECAEPVSQFAKHR